MVADMAIGIDLGTTNCCVAVVYNGEVIVIPNEAFDGSKTTPSFVAFNKDGTFTVGQVAKERAFQNLDTTIYDAKRIIGREFKDIKFWPFNVEEHRGVPKIEVRGRFYYPEEISAKLLSEMRDIAEAHLQLDPGSIKKADSDSITVLGIHGDTHLGGQDFDKNMMLYCVKKFKDETGIDMLEGKDSLNKFTRDDILKNLRRLQMHCERSKRCLSGKGRSDDVVIEGIVNGKDLCVEISRKTFDEVNDILFQKCIKVVDEALIGARVSKREIDDVILIGGSTRISKVRSLLEAYFEKKNLNVSINPDEAVAHGAAVQAAILTGKREGMMQLKQIQDVTSMSLGIQIVDLTFSVIIPKNSKIPVRKCQKYFSSDSAQTAALIEVFQGEDKVAKNNALLGDFMLRSVPKVKKGEAFAEVVMEINQNGILQVTALSIDSKEKSELTVIADKHRMSESTIQKLLTEMKM